MRDVRRPGFDLAVIGAGIVGLGHAVAAVRRGLRVVVIERATEPIGATVRNFGHIGTSAHIGPAGRYAARSRDIWLRLAAECGLWLRQPGTLILAQHDDELAVLIEAGLPLLSAEDVERAAPVRGALGGAHLAGDLQVDPREAGPAIAQWLAAQGVEFRWSTAALGVEPGLVHTARGPVRAGAGVVAVNMDVDHLFPDVAAEHHVTNCGLDMLLADGVGLQVPLLTGSSMLRYSAFASQPSASAIRERLAVHESELLEWDVNQMYTQRPDGTLVIGDTHYRGTTIPPFQDEQAFELLLRLAHDTFGRPIRVRQRWQGVYASAPQDFLRADPHEGVRVVSVTTGIGMTCGLGLAEDVIDELFGGS